jgi:hypothetical protein
VRDAERTNGRRGAGGALRQGLETVPCTRPGVGEPGSISMEKRWDFRREHAFLMVTVDKQLRAVYFALEQQVTLDVGRWSPELHRVPPSPHT